SPDMGSWISSDWLRFFGDGFGKNSQDFGAGHGADEPVVERVVDDGYVAQFALEYDRQGVEQALAGRQSLWRRPHQVVGDDAVQVMGGIQKVFQVVQRNE